MQNAALSFALFAFAVLGSLGQVRVAAAQTPPLTWVFQMRRDAQTNPHTNVFLRVGSRQILVMRQAPDEFHIAAKIRYKDIAIPTQALTACLGWWAGAGDYLYVIRRSRSLVVYRKEVDEQVADASWKRLKVIALR